MLRSVVTGVAAACAVACAAETALAQSAPSLEVGDKAPKLEDVNWLKGEPVNSFQDGHIYVLDFWATWCGPCVASIPHINKLQKEHKDDNVHVIAVAIWPSDSMTPTDEFVEMQGDAMSYRVAEDIDGKTAKAYMEATGSRGIPTVMVVDKKGQLAWMGHPMSGLDQAVELLVKDEFTQEKMAQVMEEMRREREAKQARLEPLFQRMQAAFAEEDWPELESSMTEIIAIEESMATRYAPFIYLAKVKQGKTEQARKFAIDSMSTTMAKDANALNGMAWMIVDPDPNNPLSDDERDADLAVLIASEAVELTKRKNADILDTLARAHFVAGDVQKAIDIQTEAVEMARDDSKETYQVRLIEYREAASQG
jgi:thiol-disulfide isomerase/thioredoxin